MIVSYLCQGLLLMICWLQVLTMEEIKRKVRVAIEVQRIENRENAEAV